ncbi:MAG: hypothetical protein RL341_2539, partial [Pseudomonadota bacterium]
WTKARAEELVLAASTGGFRTIALRPPFTWGVGDAVDRDIGAAIEKGRFGWFNGGCYPYATCHVLNLAEAVVCALSSTAAGRAYFITDGEPVELRNFLERRIAAAGLHAPNASVPVRLAWALAGVIEGCWRTLRLRSDPPLTRETVRLMGYPFSINALRARQELGYRPVVSVDEGLNWLTRGGSAPGSTSSVDMVKLRAAARSAS